MKFLNQPSTVLGRRRQCRRPHRYNVKDMFWHQRWEHLSVVRGPSWRVLGLTKIRNGGGILTQASRPAQLLVGWCETRPQPYY